MKRLLSTCLLLILIMLPLSGCKDSAPESTPEPPQPLYTVTISGTEIRLGETTVQTLLDQGLRVTVSQSTSDGKIEQLEIDPETELNANSYYTGGTIWLSDKVFSHIAMVTDETAIRMGDAVIARLEFYLASATEEDLSAISFDGTVLLDLNRDKAGEQFPHFKGDDTSWFESGTDYDYSMSFSSENSQITKLTATKNYDVDWNSKP